MSQSLEIKNKNLQGCGIIPEATSTVNHMVDWNHSDSDNSENPASLKSPFVNLK